MKHIIHTPNPVLTTKAQSVGIIDKKVTQIIADMKDTFLKADNPKGVGLAAPQIGVSLRIFIVKPDEADPLRVFINPVILEQSKKILDGIPGDSDRLEGCLSIPKVWGMVKRHQKILVKFMDETGMEHNEWFQDFPGVIIQHEIDHLNGILFPRRVIEQKGKLFQGVIENGKEVLEPLEL